MSNNKYKVLVIEDEMNIRSFVQTVLETNGYQVLTASTCQQGTMMFSSHIYPSKNIGSLPALSILSSLNCSAFFTAFGTQTPFSFT